ncbi:hypothetical protein [Ramlibacter albus]|uniref:Uncharacterized protein n=1 Tax=Ramlibacter albus TaxID=2079448 RepID=A0A923M358_9BURK|nr:hypothetical protein [Ramlibacter albus]MBC5763302.1 hypothetical protein [Ramlibacter albus]
MDTAASTASTCPWCGAPRALAAACPRCGADYAKADQIRRHGRAAAPPALPEIVIDEAQQVPDSEPGAVEDPALELKLCLFALPAALLAGIAFHVFAPGMQRIFLGMPVHELGHTVSAWFCGFTAVPTLWFTRIAETRGFVAPVVLGSVLCAMGWRAWRGGHRGLAGLAVLLLALQAVGTFMIDERRAEAFITFGGDGMGMVLATALMASFFFGKGTQLYHGRLRWGFLVIGAGAFFDIFPTWWTARNDYSDIPFGEMERGGPSDATRLVEWYGWSIETMVSRYSMLGACCLLVLLAIYVWGVLQASRRHA